MYVHDDCVVAPCLLEGFPVFCDILFYVEMSRWVDSLNRECYWCGARHAVLGSPVVLVVVACSVVGGVKFVDALSVVDMIGSSHCCHHVTIRARTETRTPR